MRKQTPRDQAWLTDLAAIVAEIDASAPLTPTLPRKRSRKRKPLWEE